MSSDVKQPTFGLGSSKQAVTTSERSDPTYYSDALEQLSLEKPQELAYTVETYQSSVFYSIRQLRVNEYNNEAIFLGETRYQTRGVTIIIEMSLHRANLRVYFRSRADVKLFVQAVIHQGLYASKTRIQETLQLMTSEQKQLEFEKCRRSYDQEVIIELQITNLSQSTKSLHPSPGFSMKGLVNQGNTCYMNCLLQILSHLNVFKKEVYAIPDVVPGRFPASDLFHKLDSEQERNSITTKSLLSSFEWAEEDAWIQHDVQEFFMLLIDALETKAKLSGGDGARFMKLFQGVVLSQVQCTEVEFKSSMKEGFSDIQLEVQGLKSIQESLAHYCQEEQLLGENKFQTDQFGKQAARKQTLFEQLPDVMIFHLKRFKYANGQEKVLDRFEFPAELNMKAFLVEQQQEHFSLYGILVHRGQTGQSGHYLTIIRDFKTALWVEFNDQDVRVVSETEAIDDNFGGEFTELSYMESRKRLVRTNKYSSKTAYMLVYVRSSRINEIFDQVRNDRMPEWIRKAEEEKAKQQQLREIRRNNLFLHFVKFQPEESPDPTGVLFGKQTINTRIASDALPKGAVQQKLPLEKKFAEALLDQNFLRSQLESLFICRLILDVRQNILAEQIVPFRIYSEVNLKVFAQNLSVQQQKLFLLSIEDFQQREQGSDQLLVFCRLVLGATDSVKFPPSIVSKSKRVNELRQIYQIEDGVIYMQDEFFQITRVNNPQQTFQQLLDSMEGSSGHTIQIIFGSSASIEGIQKSLEEFEVVFHNLTDGKEQTLKIHKASTFEEVNALAATLFQIEPEFLLIQFQREEELWTQVDSQLVEEIRRNCQEFPTTITEISNRVRISRHQVPFPQRSYHVCFQFEILEEDNLTSQSKEVFILKQDAVSWILHKEIENKGLFARVPKEEILLGMKNERNQLIRVTQLSKFSKNMTADQLQMRNFRLVLFYQKDFEKFQKEKRIQILCNVTHIDGLKQSFMIQCPKQMRMNEIFEQVKDLAKISSTTKTRFFLGESYRTTKHVEAITPLLLQDFIDESPLVGPDDEEQQLYLELMVDVEMARSMKTIK